MQRKTLKLAALVALAGAVLTASPVAAAPLTYTPGDLLIGFTTIQNSAGESSSYLINIGQASTFRNATQPITLSLGNVGADLTSQFSTVDTGWFNREGLRWGVFGTTGDLTVAGDGPFSLYAGRTTSTGFIRGGTFTQRIPAYYIEDIAAAYVSLGNSTANTTRGAFQDNDAVNSFFSAHNAAGSISFEYFSNAMADFGTGVGSAGLNLFRMETGSGNGQLLGALTISEAGVVTFTPVPEPSVMALALIGLGLLFFVVRRRAVRA